MGWQRPRTAQAGLKSQRTASCSVSKSVRSAIVVGFDLALGHTTRTQHTFPGFLPSRGAAGLVPGSLEGSWTAYLEANRGLGLEGRLQEDSGVPMSEFPRCILRQQQKEVMQNSEHSKIVGHMKRNRTHYFGQYILDCILEICTENQWSREVVSSSRISMFEPNLSVANLAPFRRRVVLGHTSWIHCSRLYFPAVALHRFGLTRNSLRTDVEILNGRANHGK